MDYRSGSASLRRSGLGRKPRPTTIANFRATLSFVGDPSGRPFFLAILSIFYLRYGCSEVVAYRLPSGQKIAIIQPIRTIMKKRIITLSLLSLVSAGSFFILLPLVALAAAVSPLVVSVAADEVVSGNFIRSAQVIELNGAVNGDVIAVGNTVTLNGPISGDVIALGNTVIIGGSVAGSVFAAGNTVSVTGAVAGSVHVAANSFTLNSIIDHNLWAMGATLTLAEQSSVGWDVFSMAESATLAGPVGGNVWATVDNLLLQHTVGKNVTATMGSTGKIILREGARVEGSLTYHAATDEQLVVMDGAKVTGEVIRRQVAEKTYEERFNLVYIFFRVISLFSLLMVGIVLITLLPKKLLEVKQEMFSRPWPSLGWGVLFAVVIPIAAVLLCISLIGIPLALIVLAVYLIGLYASKAIACFAIGLWLLNALDASKHYKGNLFLPLLVGLVLVSVATALPVVGGFLQILLVLWAYGALIHVKRETLREFR